MTNARPLDFEVTRPFLACAALAAGLSPSSLKGRQFRRILRGVYIHASVPPHPMHRIEAALLIHPASAFASHLSAARTYGMPIAEYAEEHVTVPRASDRRPRPGVRTHVATAPEARAHRGLNVSSPTRMFIELATLLDLVELVVVGDSLVRKRLVTPEGLVAACATSQVKGAARARRAAAYVRAEVDSPMETRLRMLIILAGLPEPQVNFKVYYGDGRLRYRFDLCYPELKLIVEYDGRQHRDDLDQWDHDTERRDWFDDHGWRIVPVFSRGIYRRPDRTIQRVRAALRSSGCRTLPRRLSDEWRPFFPVSDG